MVIICQDEGDELRSAEPARVFQVRYVGHEKDIFLFPPAGDRNQGQCDVRETDETCLQMFLRMSRLRLLLKFKSRYEVVEGGARSETNSVVQTQNFALSGTLAITDIEDWERQSSIVARCKPRWSLVHRKIGLHWADGIYRLKGKKIDAQTHDILLEGWGGGKCGWYTTSYFRTEPGVWNSVCQNKSGP